MKIIFIESQGNSSKITTGKNTNANDLAVRKPIAKYLEKNQIVCVNMVKIVQ